MELRHLRYFLALAEELHFGRAAAKLRLAQPSLSKQIRQLEDELETDLFDRTDPRRVQLTAAGLQFREGARATLLLAERTMHRAREAADGEAGRLTIAFVPSILQAPEAARILRHFRALHQGVRVELLSLRTLEQFEALRAGRVQIGFLYHPPEGDGLRADPLWRQEVMLAVPAAHPFARSGTIPIESLAREPFVWFDRPLSPAYYDLVDRAFAARGLSMDVVQEATTEPARLSLVASGLGVTLIPATEGHAPPPGVVTCRVAGLEEQMQIYAAYDPGHLTRAADAFLTGIRAALRESIPESSRKAS